MLPIVTLKSSLNAPLLCFSYILVVYERSEQQGSNPTIFLSMFFHLISDPKRTWIRMPLPEAEGIDPATPTQRVQQLGGFHHS